jgi:hypothetical protein
MDAHEYGYAEFDEEADEYPPSRSSFPRCLLTLENQSRTPAMTRKITAALPMSMAALSRVRVTAAMFVANPFAKPWIAGTRPEVAAAVEFEAAGEGEESWAGTVAAVAFDKASKMRATGMSSHVKGQ